MKLVLLGPPGAGKGTQAANLSRKYGIPAISTGHIIRTEMEAGTPVGKRAESYMEDGQLVPDDMVIKMVRDRLQQEDCRPGYILDGFPRTLSQAEQMENIPIEVDLVISLNVPEEEIVKRLSGRRGCSKCGATYHVLYNPPKQEGICDVCGEKLTVREDDRPEVIRERFQVYHEQTQPLLDYYSKRGKLRAVDGHDDVQETTRRVETAVAAG